MPILKDSAAGLWRKGLDGATQDFAAYQYYSAWEYSAQAIAAGKTPIARYPGQKNVHIEVARCPWYTQFKDTGLPDGVIAYCSRLDAVIAAGFAPVPPCRDTGFCILGRDRYGKSGFAI